MLGAHDLSAFVAHGLSGFNDLFLEGIHAPDGVVAGDETDEIRGSIRGLDGEPSDPGGGGGAAGRLRPHLPSLH